MKPTPDARDIESMLKRWAEVDAEAGRMAAERRRAVLGARASDELPEYEFGKKPNDWDWHLVTLVYSLTLLLARAGTFAP